MFIERLTKEDVEVFIKALGLNNRYEITSVDQIKIYSINRWEINMKSKSTVRKNHIYFVDFNVYGDCTGYTKQVFKAFMLAKFGDEYKQAFNENLTKKYQLELIKWGVLCLLID